MLTQRPESQKMLDGIVSMMAESWQRRRGHRIFVSSQVVGVGLCAHFLRTGTEARPYPE